jgi:hypothetical protein
MEHDSHICKFDALIYVHFLNVGDHFGVHPKISNSTHAYCGTSIHILNDNSPPGFSDALLVESHLQ